MQRRFAIVDLAFQHLHFHAFLLALVISASKTRLLPSNTATPAPAPCAVRARYGGGICKARCEYGWSVVQMINADTHVKNPRRLPTVVRGWG